MLYNNTPSNILRILALFPSYLQKYESSRRFFLEEVLSVNGLTYNRPSFEGDLRLTMDSEIGACELRPNLERDLTLMLLLANLVNTK